MYQLYNLSGDVIAAEGHTGLINTLPAFMHGAGGWGDRIRPSELLVMVCLQATVGNFFYLFSRTSAVS